MTLFFLRFGTAYDPTNLCDLIRSAIPRCPLEVMP